MPRPQKYTDSDIASAIEALVAEGETINPMRVRMRLGGGNVGRIKAVIGERSGDLALNVESAARLPEALSREFQRLSSEASQQILSVAAKCWAAAWATAASGLRDEGIRLRKHVDGLEKDLAASTDLLAQIEEQRDEKGRALDASTKERAELAQNSGSLQSALRNAESDLRAAQRIIDTFERNQRQDREDIRGLQKRIESLVSEIAVLRARSPDPGAQKTAPRKKPS
jgi:chromosome segregation ATPase